jgi:hypothetical protein
MFSFIDTLLNSSTPALSNYWRCLYHFFCQLKLKAFFLFRPHCCYKFECVGASAMITEIPKVQTAALIKDAGPNARIVIRDDYPVSKPGENEVLLKMECSGIWSVQIVIIDGDMTMRDLLFLLLPIANL